MVGPIPAGAFLCHHCDVRNCVNPDHLYIGDHQSNMADMRARHRNHSRARLTVQQVSEIKAAKGVLTGPQLAEMYGINKWHVYDIWRGRKWAWVDA